MAGGLLQEGGKERRPELILMASYARRFKEQMTQKSPNRSYFSLTNSERTEKREKREKENL